MSSSPPTGPRPPSGDAQQGVSAILTVVNDADGKSRYVLRPFFRLPTPDVERQMAQMLGFIHANDSQLFQFLQSNKNFLTRLSELPEVFEFFGTHPETLRPLLNLMASTLDLAQFYSNFGAPVIAPAASKPTQSLPPVPASVSAPHQPAGHNLTPSPVPLSIVPSIANLPQPRHSSSPWVPRPAMGTPSLLPGGRGPPAILPPEVMCTSMLPYLSFLQSTSSEYQAVLELIEKTTNPPPLTTSRMHSVSELRVAAILRIYNQELERVYQETAEELRQEVVRRGTFPFSKEGLRTWSTDFARQQNLDEEIYESIAYCSVRVPQPHSESEPHLSPLDIIATVSCRGFASFERTDCYGEGVHLYDFFDFADLGSSRLLNKYQEISNAAQYLRSQIARLFSAGNEAVAAVIVSRVCLGKSPHGLLRYYSTKETLERHTAIVSRLTPENLAKCVTCSYKQVLPLYVVVYERVSGTSRAENSAPS